MPAQLYLVRHGQTAMNRRHQLQSITDVGLTAKGVAQAHATGQQLQAVPFTQAFSSDRLRAVQTAELILSHQSALVPVKQQSGLREVAFGGLEGLTNRQVVWQSLRRFGLRTMLRRWLNPNTLVATVTHFQQLDRTGQAESYASLMRRAKAELTLIAQQAAGPVLVVGHSFTLAAMMAVIAPQAVPRTLLKNGSVTRIDVTATGLKVVAVNQGPGQLITAEK